jgi:hypothetical protein
VVKEESMKLSIACGQNIPEGFVGMDIVKGKGVKYVGDILDFWSKDNVWSKIDDNSVDEIDCTMFVEHIPHIIEGKGMKAGYDDCFYLFFDQVHRILKPAEFDPNNPNIPTKGFAKITCPYYSSMRCWQDPTHARAISEASFLYLNEQWRKDNKLDHYPVSCDFDFQYAYNIDQQWGQRNVETQGFAIKHYSNAVNDIIVTLTKRSK